jgi:hypothetical protein
MTAQLILNFETLQELSEMLPLLKKMGLEQQMEIRTNMPTDVADNKKSRQPGWAKNIFRYIAPDFDDTPSGFEEYQLPPKS